MNSEKEYGGGAGFELEPSGPSERGPFCKTLEAQKLRETLVKGGIAQPSLLTDNASVAKDSEDKWEMLW
jgi:hypothetical protein